MNATKKQKKRGIDPRRGLHLALGGLLGALVVPACANHVRVPAEIATCPCANGAFCCSSGVCAADATGCDVATAALSNSVAGDWQGYFEDFSPGAENQALITDDSLAISIVVAEDGTMSGHVTMGQTPPPPPPTDPTAAWPSVLDLELATFDSSNYPLYIAGFAYRASDIRWEAHRLRFQIDRSEPWQSWCHLQPIYPQLDGTYGAAPSGQRNFVGNINSQTCYVPDGDGNPVPGVSCAQESLSEFCACDTTGCGAAAGPVYTFDIALRDGIGDGTTSLTASPIRLIQARQN